MVIVIDLDLALTTPYIYYCYWILLRTSTNMVCLPWI